jgi:hypothetical protein
MEVLSRPLPGRTVEKSPVRTGGKPVEMRTRNLPNTSLLHGTDKDPNINKKDIVRAT